MSDDGQDDLDPTLSSTDLVLRGRKAEMADQFERAERCYRRALELDRAAGERMDEGVDLALLGQVAWITEDLDRADDLLEEALRIHQECGDDVNMAATLVTLGQVAQLRGSYDEARQRMHTALAMERRRDDRQGIRSTLYTLARSPRKMAPWGKPKAICASRWRSASNSAAMPPCGATRWSCWRASRVAAADFWRACALAGRRADSERRTGDMENQRARNVCGWRSRRRLTSSSVELATEMPSDPHRGLNGSHGLRPDGERASQRQPGTDRCEHHEVAAPGNTSAIPAARAGGAHAGR